MADTEERKVSHRLSSKEARALREERAQEISVLFYALIWAVVSAFMWYIDLWLLINPSANNAESIFVLENLRANILVGTAATAIFASLLAIAYLASPWTPPSVHEDIKFYWATVIIVCATGNQLLTLDSESSSAFSPYSITHNKPLLGLIGLTAAFVSLHLSMKKHIQLHSLTTFAFVTVELALYLYGGRSPLALAFDLVVGVIIGLVLPIKLAARNEEQAKIAMHRAKDREA